MFNINSDKSILCPYVLQLLTDSIFFPSLRPFHWSAANSVTPLSAFAMPWVNKTPVLFSHHILQRKEEWKNRFLPELLSVQLETLHVLLNPEKLAHQSWRWITCCIFRIRNLSFSTRCTQTCFLKKQQNSSFEFGDLISFFVFFINIENIL